MLLKRQTDIWDKLQEENCHGKQGNRLEGTFRVIRKITYMELWVWEKGVLLGVSVQQTALVYDISGGLERRRVDKNHCGALVFIKRRPL